MATNTNGCLPASVAEVESATSKTKNDLSMLSNATATASSQPDPEAKAKKQFFAIRRCEGLTSPAIFSDWGDCSVYVDPMENDGSVVEFKSFPTIQEAISYAFGVSMETQQQVPQSPSVPAAVGSGSDVNTSVPNTQSGVDPASSSANKMTTPIAHSKSGGTQGERSTSWNSEVAVSTASGEGATSSTSQTTVPAVTPTEMDTDHAKNNDEGGPRGGRNYRRSVNTTYSSGEDEPVEESTGKNPVEPSVDDVLCGRGGLTNHHPGNKRFRSIVKQYQQDYLRADRGKKASFGHKIYSEIKSHQGRFLQRMPGSSKQWYDIGKVRAIAKICQALREDAPTIRGGKRQQNRSQQQQNGPPSGIKRPHPQDTPDMAQVGPAMAPTSATPIMSTPTHHMPPHDMTAYYQSQPPPPPPPHHLPHPGMHAYHYPSPANHPAMQPMPSPAPEPSPQAPPQKMQKRLSHLDQLLAAANMAQAPSSAPEGQAVPSQSPSPPPTSVPPTGSPQPKPFGPIAGTPTNASQRDFPPASHTSPHVVMFMKTCAPLQGVPPPYFQGNMDEASKVNLPEFMMLANYPNIASNQCKMCGLERALKSKTAKASAKKDANKEPTIPSQNKGVCTACDSQIWVVIDERPEAAALKGNQIKWCKGCKNFRPWASFGFKGSATKCAPCRESQAERYKGRKQAKQQLMHQV